MAEAAYEAADLLISARANVDVSGEDGDTPLMWAIEKNDVRLVSLLLDSGADINHCDSGLDDGSPALYSAVKGHKEEVTALLLEHGCAVNARGGVQHQTALMIAARYVTQGGRVGES